MADFVLVHGAWHGSWCWKRLRDVLRTSGHRVFTPTLTGLGERSHLLSRDIGLQTHVADVANLLVWEELNNIVLVGHSYGGIVVRNVADRMPERIGALVYLDAFVPENGEALVDLVPDGGESFRQSAAEAGDGWKVPPLPASALGVNSEDAVWVNRQCTAHPLACLEDVTRIGQGNIANTGYVLARFANPFFERFAERAREKDWWVEEIVCGHDVMIDQPEELAAILVRRTLPVICR